MNETPRSDRSLVYFIILMVFYWAILIPIFTADNDSDVRKLDSQEWQQAVEERAFVLDSEQKENQPVVEDENRRMPGPLLGPRGEFQQAAQDKDAATEASDSSTRKY